ncbi:hypothetical protein [Legionella septentrionalis]|uniref:hypothetical protein n=1 Tax=Legionella septentrionalis TaxID=2498109 RepID=UPI000F8D8E8B|nr:hypothetical protein [Legionella septentrionalis]RUQ95069.1 hypothetical protein ELY11_10050 [Legionella septentrionalis]RUR13701.1 hypothetical protein ELY10_10050 [Legionella septentrionalis]
MPANDILKKELENELIRKAKAELAELRNKERQEEIATKAGDREEANAAADEKWAEVDKIAEEFIRSSQRGFDNPLSQWLDILFLCMKLAEAARKSNPVNSLLNQGLDQIQGLIGQFRYSKDMKNANSFAEEDPEKRAQIMKELNITLPRIQHCVTMNDNDELELGSIVGENGKPIFENPQLQQYAERQYAALVVAWLQTHGYTRINTGTFVHQDPPHRQLDRDTFEALRDDLHAGLNQRAEEQFGLEFVTNPSLRP